MIPAPMSARNLHTPPGMFSGVDNFLLVKRYNHGKNVYLCPVPDIGPIFKK